MHEVVKQNKQQRIEMYNKKTKEEIISMLRERDNVLYPHLNHCNYSNMTKDELVEIISSRDIIDMPMACAEFNITKEDCGINTSCSITTTPNPSNLKKELSIQWKYVCEEYLIAFIEKHEYEYNDYSWVGDEPGTVAIIGDIFANFDDIRYDIDNDIPTSKFEEWYYKSVDIHELTNDEWLSYKSYCEGAPDKYTDDVLMRLHKSYAKMEKYKMEFENFLNELKEQF